MDKNLFRVFVIVLIGVFLLAGCENKTNSNEGATDGSVTNDISAQNDTQAENDPLLQDVSVAEVFSYSGPYVEDGANEECKNICAVRIENKSSVHYQYLHFTVKIGGTVYTFKATTLFAGAKMTVLCEDRSEYRDGDIESVEFLAAAPFAEKPTVHLDTLEITYTDGFINVKNKTDKTLKNVYVYYKNTDDYGFIGGITYRVSFGNIGPGGLVQMGTANIRSETGKIVFSTYEE